jgi:hypothetical protein
MTAAPGAPSAGAAEARTDAQIRNQLLGSLEQRILTEAAGALVPAGVRLPGRPQMAWLGQLASEPQLIADRNRGLPGDRLVPAAEGFSFRSPAARTPVGLDLTLSFSVYFALHPTLAEQRAFVNDVQGTGAAGGGPGATGGSAQGRQLALVWAKVPVGPVSVHASIDADVEGSLRFGASEIAAAVAAAVRPPGGCEPYRTRRRATPAGSLPRDADMHDAAAWASYTASNLLAVTDAALPRFGAAVDVDVTAAEAGRDILLTVVNVTPADDAQFADRAGGIPFDRPHLDTRLYEVCLTATTDVQLEAYDLEQVARSHRYDRTVDAFGQACPVVVTRDPAAGTTTLSTAYGASTATRRVHPRSTTRAGVVIDASFDALIADPVGAVNAITDAHAEWVDEHWSTVALNARAATRGWDGEARADAGRDAQAARDEVDWIRAGAKALAANADLRDAFVAMNRAMKVVGASKGYASWRLFQIAWIVGCLPAVADPAADLDVQIETVQTGTGKSEGYLGVVLVHLFYARLTGGTAGVNVWARFPLRLLSAQQTGRFAQAVLAAEVLRQDDPRIAAGDPFGVGFFVGSANTPNRIYSADSPFARGQDPTDPVLAERCRVLEHCPCCDPRGNGPRLVVRFDEPTWSMQHVCTNTSCRLSGVLPVWVVDDDVYRRAPSVLVGTVDRLAQIAQSPQFQIVFGRVHSRCPRHGYSADPSFCAVFGCSLSRAPVGRGFGHLRCEIADELHLLEESLGALDGMYETLAQQIGARLGNEPLHIVAATATLEGYENQVHHLYRRGARRFPAPGPDAGETFFSYTDSDDPLRRYVGVRPRGVTMVTASADVARMHAQWLAAAVADPVGAAAAAGLDATDPGVIEVVTRAVTDDYAVLLGYCLRNEDLSSFTRDDRVAELLDSQDNLVTISGNVDQAVILEAVSRLDSPPGDPMRQVRIIAATKAIGHGFDSPRLGFMVLMGTPTQAAEVIQATARVGRIHPGLVVHVFNPSRDRDSSVFRYYSAWIRFLDRLVHKVPINRESLPVLRRVLSGALMAWLLQVHNVRWMTSGSRRYSLAKSEQLRDALAAGFIDRVTLVSELSAGLGLDPANPYHDMHRAAVERFVDDTMSRLAVAASPQRRTAELLDPSVPRSLRDIEEPISIYGNV